METAKDPLAGTAQEPGPTAQERTDFEQLLSKERKAFSLVPTSLEELTEYARLIASSNLCPRDYRGKPGDIAIAVQMGAGFGIPAIQSLQNITVINDRPCMWGVMVTAIVKHCGAEEYTIDEWDEATQTATVRTKRKGKPEAVKSFSMADAKRAVQISYKNGVRKETALADKDTYKSFPKDMLTWKAKHRAFQAEYADVLMGLAIQEEIEDFDELLERPYVPPVQMPQRKSATLTEQVDSLIHGEEAPQQAQPQQKPGPTSPQTPPSPGLSWQGAIVSVETRTGTTNNRSWAIHDVKGADGTLFGTFSDTMKASAEQFAGTGELCRITYTVTVKGNHNITEIQPVQAPEPETGE